LSIAGPWQRMAVIILKTKKMNGIQITGIIVIVFMMLAGAGIIFIWAADIFSGKFSDQGNFLMSCTHG
jgi:hypothetical protein